MNDLNMKIDTNKVFTEFFKLRDWKSRSLGIGGLYLIFLTTIFIAYLFFIFLGLGEVILAAFFMILVIIATLIGFLILQFYLAGYKLDLIKVMTKNGEVESVGYLANYGTRISQGFKLNLSFWAYILIPTMISFIGGFVNGFSTELIETAGFSLNDGYWIFVFIGYGISAVGGLLQFLTRLFFYPLITARFLANDFRIADTINLSQVVNTVRSNFKELLIIGGLIFLVQAIITFSVYMSAFLVLLCIGLFLFPVVVAIGSIYMVHFEARMVSSIINSPIINQE